MRATIITFTYLQGSSLLFSNLSSVCFTWVILVKSRELAVMNTTMIDCVLVVVYELTGLYDVVPGRFPRTAANFVRIFNQIQKHQHTHAKVPISGKAFL